MGPPPPSTSSPGCLAGSFQLLGSKVPERQGEEHSLLQYVSRPGLFCVQTGVGVPALRRCWVGSWAWSTPTSSGAQPQLKPLQARVLPGVGPMEGHTWCEQAQTAWHGPSGDPSPHTFTRWSLWHWEGLELGRARNPWHSCWAQSPRPQFTLLTVALCRLPCRLHPGPSPGIQGPSPEPDPSPHSHPRMEELGRVSPGVEKSVHSQEPVSPEQGGCWMEGMEGKKHL